jgi:hypothetical protein
LGPIICSRLLTSVNVWLKGFKGWNRKLAAVVIAVVIWGILKTKIFTCFQRKWPDEPICVIYRICYWIVFLVPFAGEGPRKGQASVARKAGAASRD